MRPKKKSNNEVFSQKTDAKTPRSLGPISDLERHLPREWWKTLFNSLYLKTDGDVVENIANTKVDIDLLIEATGIRTDQSILDVCCGQGRHSLELARRGYTQVQGVDRSRYLIRLARKRAKDEGLMVQFSEGDARKLKVLPQSMDCIFLMGNSFGYFEQEEDDEAVLISVKNALRSHGKLVLDIVDGNWMSQNFEPRSWEWIDQHHFVNRERLLAEDGKRIITREVVTNTELGVIADQFYAERLYRFDEIKAVLEKVGFYQVQQFGSVQSVSTRGQDLGMMAHRLFISCLAPEAVKAKTKTKTKTKKITVLLGDPRLSDPIKKEGQFNSEDLEVVHRLQQTLKSLDHYQFSYFDNHKTLVKQIIQTNPEFVFNLCDEGYNNQPRLELHVPALLEMLNIPYTGSGPACLALCYDKSKVRSIAQDMDIPVPLETFFNPSDQAANIPTEFPALLKPACGDGSIGITQNAVVNNAKELMDYLHYLRETLPGVGILVQEYLQGSEFSVALIGNTPNLEALPLLEINYDKLPNTLPKILPYESKWHPESPYWNNIEYVEANVEEDLRSQMINTSKQLFERLGCRDYARFDFRCDAQNIPKLLEVNPNPGWCWDGKLNLMAEFAGLSYAQLLNKILTTAFERTGREVLD